MHDLQLVGLTTDRRGLIFRPRAGARTDAGFVVPVTDDLVALVAELADELAAEPPEPDTPTDRPETPAEVEAAAKPRSQMSVRDIQARLRAGEPVTQVAREAGVDEDWIERFAPPIRAEQRRIVDRALEHHLQRARSAPSAVPLRRAVGMALAEKGIAYTVAAFDAAWSAHLLGHDRWAVSFTYRHRGHDRTATWTYDAADDELTTSDRTAAQLGYVAPGAASEDDGQAIDGIIGDPEATNQIGTASPGGRSRRSRTVSSARSGTVAGDPAKSPSKRSGPKATSTGRGAPRKGAAKKPAASTKKVAAAKKRSAATKKVAATKKRSAATKKVAATKKRSAATKKVAAAKKRSAASKKVAAAKKRSAATEKVAATKKAAAKKSKKKSAAAKSPATRASTKKASAKKSTAKRSTAKRSTAKRSTAKRSTAKKAATKRSATKEKASVTQADQGPVAAVPADDAIDAASVLATTAPAQAPGDVVAAERRPEGPVTAAIPSEVAPAESVEVAPPRSEATARAASEDAVATAPPRRSSDTPGPSRDTRRPDEHTVPARPVAGRPGQVPIADVPLARRPPAGNGRSVTEGRAAASPVPDVDREPPPEPDPVAARRARAAERNAPTVQFRSGSAAPVRAAGAAPDAQVRRAPGSEPSADRSRTEPSASNGAARPEIRRRRQLRAR